MARKKSNSSNLKPSGSDNASKKQEEKDAQLDEIAENISSYFKKFDHFKKYEEDIKNKYKKYYPNAEPLPDCWPVEFINKAWKKTEDMYKHSGRRKCWSLAILFQVMKRMALKKGSDENVTEAQSDVKKESQQSGGDHSANKPVYIRIPFSEMINSKECYRSDTVAEDKESKDKERKTSNTVAKDKERKTSNTVAKDKERKTSNTVANDKERKTSNTVAKDKESKDKKCNASNKDNQNIVYKFLDKVPSPTQILQNKFYITLYDNQTRNAAWVYEILNKSPKANNNVKRKKYYPKDASVHPLFQPSTESYNTNETGYNHGHLAAAANHKWCQEAYDDTFLLSNIVPQQHNFNSDMWQLLEELCQLTAEDDEVRNVHVYTGPLYLLSESKDNNDVNKTKNSTSEKRVEYEIVGGKAVPTHLFKVIIVEKKDGTVLAPECYKMPNKTQKHALHVKVESNNHQWDIKMNIKELQDIIKNDKSTIDVIQRDSGLIFEETDVKEEMTDGTYKVHWRKNPDENEGTGKKGTLIEVSVSGSYADHSDRAVLH